MPQTAAPTLRPTCVVALLLTVAAATAAGGAEREAPSGKRHRQRLWARSLSSRLT